MAGMCFAICCVFLYVFAVNLPMLLGGQAIASCAWGIFSGSPARVCPSGSWLTADTLTAAYAVEVCPIQLRGYAAGFISMAWGMGSFIASGVNRAALDVDGNWGWRMGYAVQWFWPLILLPASYFAPESEWPCPHSRWVVEE